MLKSSINKVRYWASFVLKVYAISYPPLDYEIAVFGGLFQIQGLLGRQISVQPKCKQIFKIASQTQQTCDLVSDKK